MKKQKNSWLSYCLVILLAIGMMSALVGCDTEVKTPKVPTDDNEYTITISSAIAEAGMGTVTANPMTGKARTSITVTATPAEATQDEETGETIEYELKPGSLTRTYKNTSGRNTTTAIPASGKFNMPASDVTINAIFQVKQFGYGQYKNELETIIEQMTLEEKIGQMTQAERGQLQHPDGFKTQIANNFLGSVLSGGASGPGAGAQPQGGNNDNTPIERWWAYTDAMLKASLTTPPRGYLKDLPNPVDSNTTGYGIPYVYGIDAVHGHANAIQYPTVFPHNIGMGAIYVGDPAKGLEGAKEAGRVTAAEMYTTGHRFNFNPVLGVGENTSWGRMYESFSQNPDVVAAMGAAYVTGLQSTGKVGACGKHYGFEGQVAGSSGITSGNAEVGDLHDEANLKKISPYKAAIDAGLLSVMTFYGRVNGNQPVRYKDLIDILKVDWGFEGFVITDWSNMGTGEANIAGSINAGVDMNMAAGANEWQNFIRDLKSVVDDGTVPMTRIDDAVYRILLFKKVFGILDDPIVEWNPDHKNGSDEHRLIARNIASKTLVLLKNEEDVVGTLAKGTYKNILVTGAGAASVGIQCGGWTRAWQGQTNATLPNFDATNIVDGLTNGKRSDQTVLYSEGGSIPSGGTVPAGWTPDVIIAVAGERPYAEGTGDIAVPYIGSGLGISGDANMLNAVYAHNKPVILIIISGRPQRLGSGSTGTAMTEYRDKSKGIVAAWLPGSEAGDAIADILLNESTDPNDGYQFVGKTAFTWYENGKDGAVSYPYGWGLKKGETGTPTAP